MGTTPEVKLPTDLYYFSERELREELAAGIPNLFSRRFDEFGNLSHVSIEPAITNVTTEKKLKIGHLASDGKTYLDSSLTKFLNEHLPTSPRFHGKAFIRCDIVFRYHPQSATRPIAGVCEVESIYIRDGVEQLENTMLIAQLLASHKRDWPNLIRRFLKGGFSLEECGMLGVILGKRLARNSYEIQGARFPLVAYEYVLAERRPSLELGWRLPTWRTAGGKTQPVYFSASELALNARQAGLLPHFPLLYDRHLI